jgi:hypothetical protein
MRRLCAQALDVARTVPPCTCPQVFFLHSAPCPGDNRGHFHHYRYRQCLHGTPRPSTRDGSFLTIREGIMPPGRKP